MVVFISSPAHLTLKFGLYPYIKFGRCKLSSSQIDFFIKKRYPLSDLYILRMHVWNDSEKLNEFIELGSRTENQNLSMKELVHLFK